MRSNPDLRAALRRAVAIVSGIWIVACSGDRTLDPTPPPPPPVGLVASDPVLTASLASSTNAAPALRSTVADTFVYVSLPPGSFPTGRSAVLGRVGDAATITTTVLDGGFDPIPVAAQAGDSIEVVIKNGGGSPITTLGLSVTARRPPVVVRTDPPPKKRDVPLNSVMVIVFSEPVDSRTVTSSSVQVVRGTTTVAGSVRLLAGTGTLAAFTPAVPLDPNTDYELVVTTAVTDLDGDALEERVSAPFTTGHSSTGPPASISVTPDTIYMTGGAYQMTATVRDAAGDVLTGQPTWSTSNATGLTVSSTGLVTALVTGSYTVTARLNELTASALIVVVTGPPAFVDISPAPATVGASGDTIIVSATVRDARGRVINYPSVTWASSAPGVATVAVYNPVGLGPGLATVTGVSLGNATITATTGTASGTASITVIAPLPVASVTVSPDTATLLLQTTRRLSVTVRDANGKILPGRAVAWTIDNGTVGTVDATGLIAAVGAGAATVTATSEGVSDSAAIGVVALRVATMAAGVYHSCAVTVDGIAYCWGNNEFGQLGTGSYTSRSLPTAVAGGLTFSAVSAYNLSSCAVTTSGAAYCWGSNGNGRLGNGSATSSTVPVAVSGGLTFSAVATGAIHTCALTTGGAAYCWGGNTHGELGDGSTTSSSVPVAVRGGFTFSTISTWGQHTCGLTVSGAAYCWGYNGSGQLGDGSTDASSVPVAVSGGLSFSAITAGLYHTCGRTVGGAAYCWGRNGYGQLGNGTTDSSSVPVLVTGGLSFSAITPGGLHTCGLTTDGVAYCWGDNSAGQLGDGSFTIPRRLVPTGVAGGLTFSSVTAGGLYTCALATTGVAYCWGSNLSGQLGNATGFDSATPVRVLGQP